MRNAREIIAAAVIGLVVATFLLNTRRALKAIELCKESLVLLNNQALGITQQLGKLIYKEIYVTIFNAYYRIHDNKNVLKYGRKLLVIHCECGEKIQEGLLSMVLGEIYQSQNKYVDATELYERAVSIMRGIGDRETEAIAYGKLGAVSLSLGEYVKAKEYLEKALPINVEFGDRAGEATNCGNLGAVFRSLGDYVKAEKYLEKALEINMEIDDREGTAANYGIMGLVFKSLGNYVKSKEYLEKALAINMEVGETKGAAANYENMGIVLSSLNDYMKAKEYLEKALEINIKISDRAGEAANYRNMGAVLTSLRDYDKAKEYLEKALAIYMETGDRKGEATIYENLGHMFESLGNFVKAKEYFEKALVINMETCHIKGEATSYENIGHVFKSLGDYVKAKEYLEKALVINMETSDRVGEATNYRNMGAFSTSLRDYDKAKEYLEKALAIYMETGDRKGEATIYVNLGHLFESLGDYMKAKQYFDKSLVINMETGHRKGEAKSYENIGHVFKSLGDYVKAKEYLEKALVINMEIGDRAEEGTTYGNLGNVFGSFGDCVKAEEYFEKALALSMQVGDKAGEASIYGQLGSVYLNFRQFGKSKEYFEKGLAVIVEIGDRKVEATLYEGLGGVYGSLGDYINAKKYYEKALAIKTETADRLGEAVNYAKLGSVLHLMGDYVIAEEYFEKALLISQDMRHAETEYKCYCLLSSTKLLQDKFHEAFSCLYQSLQKSEDLRGFNVVNDQIKMFIADRHVFPYVVLCRMLCGIGDSRNALCVAELGRARVLADLMSIHYSTKTHISANPQSWISIGNSMTKENTGTRLYISYDAEEVLLWVLKTSGVISFRLVRVDKKTLYERLAKPAENLDEFFALMVSGFLSFGILPEDFCEDRSLSDTEPAQSDSSQEEGLASLQRGNDKEDPESSLTLLYKTLINPVADLLEEPEIIIVPDRNLYRVPFAALLDENLKYLSETFRIRIVPSLTTLKLIQDSSVDCHSQAGSLIVGDPDVGDVIYKGRLKTFVPLPGARKEAEIIGRLLGVHPLLGQHATKQAVLQRLSSVSLIHIAAHGNAERGEIAFAPPSSTTGIPQEGDFLLKMSEISKVQLRAKLVVLSCCHSGRGQIRAKGVVGIAHAFLGSGARSVLVALWALGDIATEKLMNCFYKHLVRGESASESLHEAMKWMRENGFTKVSEWAPFILIRDNVTFDVGTLKVSLK